MIKRRAFGRAQDGGVKDGGETMGKGIDASFAIFFLESENSNTFQC